MILDRYEKQPGELLDYDIDYTPGTATGLDTGDTLASIVVTADTGITVASSAIITPAYLIAKIWLSGGTSGVNYKVTCKATTTGGRQREDEIIIKVRER